MTAPASLLDFADKDPFPFYETLRAQGSPQWDEKANGWLILDYQQCCDCERDESRFGNAYVHADATLKEIKGGGANVTLSQEPEHMALRKFHLKLLSPSSVERYRTGHIVPVIESLLGRVVDRDRFDLCAEIGDQVPPRVICSLLGMPFEDDEAMARILYLNGCIVNYIASGYRDPQLRDVALEASRELNATLLPYVQARRAEPHDDFISRVWQQAPEAGLDLDDAGVLGLCRELYFAGSDTTVHGIANLFHLLLADEELFARVKAERGKALTHAIEESLRLLNVVQFRHRICVEDTKVGDAQIRQGQAIFLVHAAANRDPSNYPHPQKVDLDRKAPTDHLAFGKGTRACVGAQLARVEMFEVASRLMDRFPDMRLDPDAEPPAFASLFIRSMRPLNIITGR
jgi:cytochrome P450